MPLIHARVKEYDIKAIGEAIVELYVDSDEHHIIVMSRYNEIGASIASLI